MASAYVSYGKMALPAPSGFSYGVGSSVLGSCVKSEVLTVSGTTATGAVVGNSAMTVARIETDSAACFVAVGTTPDPTATTATAATSAGRYLGSGKAMDLLIGAGMKVAVKAVA